MGYRLRVIYFWDFRPSGTRIRDNNFAILTFGETDSGSGAVTIVLLASFSNTLKLASNTLEVEAFPLKIVILKKW